MAVIPAGTALLGAPAGERGAKQSEQPQRDVRFARSFAIARMEASFDEWQACVSEGGCDGWSPDDFGMGNGRNPVIFVSWSDANAYAKWLSAKTGATYRLPSEAEWEYAARACRDAGCGNPPFSFGAEIAPADAVYNWNISYAGSERRQSKRRTSPVDENSRPNAFGLLHVHGNVAEWTLDCQNRTLDGLPGDGTSRRTGDCDSHVVRGGAWDSDPAELRAAARSWQRTDKRSYAIGFRLARDLGPGLTGNGQ